MSTRRMSRSEREGSGGGADISSDTTNTSGTPDPESNYFVELGNDKKLWVTLGVIQIVVVGCFLMSLSNRIENLKSCRRSEQGSVDPLSCSDCMCIATEEFSSKEFKQIINKQELLSDELRNVRESISEAKTSSVKRGERIDLLDDKYGSIQNNIDDLNRKIDSLPKEHTIPEDDKKNIVQTLESKIQESFRTIQSNLEKKLQDIQNSNMDLKTSIQDQVQSIEEEMKKILQSVKAEREKALKSITQDLDKVKKWVSENFTSYEDKLAGFTGQLNYFFKELKDINLYIVGFLFLVVIGVIFVAYKILLSKQTGDRMTQYRNIADPPSTAPRSRVGGKFFMASGESMSKRSLENSIGIISFNASTQEFHQHLFDGVPEFSSRKVNTCYIRNTDNIQQIRPSKVVFIFVDFNERNIILEDPETEIGDIRRLTTQGLLNMGCDVFVVYVRDRGSKTLRPDQLYNPQLYSIERHPILSKLKERNRVLSVYSSFLPHQVKFLEDCLKRL